MRWRGSCGSKQLCEALHCAGQRRHGPVRRELSRSRTRHPRRWWTFAKREGVGLVVVGAGGAAGRRGWSTRCEAGRDQGVRAQRRRRPARGRQGLRQAVDAARRRSRRPRRASSPTTPTPRQYIASRDEPAGGQGGRAGQGQGRDRLRRAGPGASGRSSRSWSTGSSAPPATRWSSRSKLLGEEASILALVRRADSIYVMEACPGPQAHRRRRHRPQHRRHGRLQPRARHRPTP